MCLIDRVLGEKLLEPPQRVLAIEQFQLLIDLWISLVQQIRSTEEVLAGHGEKFGRVLGGIGIYRGLGVRMAIKLSVEIIIGFLHDFRPVADPHVGMQRWQAIGIAVEHVEFVRQFVDHQVVAFPAAAGHHARPGEDDRALLPGFAAVLAIPFVLDTAGVAMPLRTEEIVGVEDDFVKTLVLVQVAQVQQWQLRLGREQQALLLMEFNARQGGQVFVLQE